MNRQKIEQLRDQYLHDKSIIFAMPDIVAEHPCGSALCIAGQVTINAGYDLRTIEDKWSDWSIFIDGKAVSLEPWDIAQSELGLSEEQCDLLFLKSDWPDDLYKLPDTPALAAERLQRFLDSDGRE